MLQIPASRTRTSAHPGRNFGTGFEIALNFLFTVRKESTGRSSSFSSYLYGIVILPAKPSGPAPPFSPAVFQNARSTYATVSSKFLIMRSAA